MYTGMWSTIFLDLSNLPWAWWSLVSTIQFSTVGSKTLPITIGSINYRTLRSAWFFEYEGQPSELSQQVGHIDVVTTSDAKQVGLWLVSEAISVFRMQRLSQMVLLLTPAASLGVMTDNVSRSSRS